MSSRASRGTCFFQPKVEWCSCACCFSNGAMRTFWVYVLASRSRVLYVGVTNDLLRRLMEHRLHKVAGFTAKYRVNRLVHLEETTGVEEAIAREKQIKGWRRSKKIELIEKDNPTWIDLSETWFEE